MVFDQAFAFDDLRAGVFYVFRVQFVPGCSEYSEPQHPNRTNSRKWNIGLLKFFHIMTIFFNQDMLTQLINSYWGVALTAALVLALVVAWDFPFLFFGDVTEWKSATVVITGGGAGIGLEVAKECVRLGARYVHLLDVDEQSLLVARQSLLESATSPDVLEIETHICDVSYNFDLTHTSDAIQAVINGKVATTDHDDGRPTAPCPLVLFNNAGIVSGKEFESMKPGDFERTMSINVAPAFTLTRLLLPTMRQRRGSRVVNVASVMGLIGGARLADYCASKWAIIGASESLRLELQA